LSECKAEGNIWVVARQEEKRNREASFGVPEPIKRDIQKRVIRWYGLRQAYTAMQKALKGAIPVMN